MTNQLGRFLRILRIENQQVLKDMADILGVSSAFLSAVENGKKNMPVSWHEKLRVAYNLSPDQYDALEQAALESQKSISLNLENIPEANRQLAVSFARQFSDLDEETSNKILTILHNKKGVI